MTAIPKNPRQIRSVLMVCTGNICRSPTADGLLRHALREAGLDGIVEVDSAGTHGYHVGEPPDPRSIATAQRNGVDIAGLRARKVAGTDFDRFDLILAMDRSHLVALQRMSPAPQRQKIKLYLDFAPQHGSEIPDPYYGGPEGFDAVWRMCEAVTLELMWEISAGLSENPTKVSGK